MVFSKSKTQHTWREREREKKNCCNFLLDYFTRTDSDSLNATPLTNPPPPHPNDEIRNSHAARLMGNCGKGIERGGRAGVAVWGVEYGFANAVISTRFGGRACYLEGSAQNSFVALAGTPALLMNRTGFQRCQAFPRLSSPINKIFAVLPKWFLAAFNNRSILSRCI